jgi:hypothetical protein
MKIPTILLLLSLALVGFAGSAQAQCGNCQPGVKPSYTPGSSMTIYIDPSLTAQESNAASAAITGWNQWFVQQGFSAPYTVTTNASTANVTIKEDPQLHNSGIAGSTSPGSITTNPDYNGRTDGFLANVISHEIGHAIGFTDVFGSGCQGQTVMFGNISVGGPYTTGPTGVDQCQLGQYNPPPSAGDNDTLSQCDSTWGCAEPIVFTLGNGGYHLSGLEDPVAFDIFGAGPRGGKPWIGWTERGTDIAFLAFDRNDNGIIDGGGELFGNGTLLKTGEHAPNGFEALAQYDTNGDGLINASDPVWQFLLLWIDRSHDGVSQQSELQRINASSITAIEIAHRWTFRHDQSGNYYGYQGAFFEGLRRHVFYDVFFVIAH